MSLRGRVGTVLMCGVLVVLVGPGPVGGVVPGRDGIEAKLARVRVLAEAPYHPGYDRNCDPGACVFGPLWTDDHPGPFGHNGCDTRQDVLLQQMRRIELRWDSRCRIYQAFLTDPYTGERLTWRDDGYRIQIDHLYPLARAWHGGAWAWPQRRRLRFANDVRYELQATTAEANQAKEAGSPAEWLPPRRAYRCRYVNRYLTIAIRYDLPVTTADVQAIRALGCP